MSKKQTPLMQQYFKIKAQYPDTLLFFQVGDFYELFFDDAKKASAYLAIALTKRGKNNGQDVPLCGVPIHALNHYLVKLIKGGFRVAICNQLTKPEPGKVVERGVTQVFTPGTLTDSTMLDEKSASYILSFFPQKDSWGLLFTELLTAQIFATRIPANEYKMVESELIRFFPDEIILPNFNNLNSFGNYFRQQGYVITFSDFVTDSQDSKLWVENQFDPKTLNLVSQFPAIFSSLNLLYFYLKKNQENSLNQFKNIQFYEPDDFLILDAATQRNLEIVKNGQDGSRKNSLLSIVDKSKTPMGSRTIKKWLLRPLVQKQKIIYRQEVVGKLSQNIDLMQQLEERLSAISDLERIVGRIALRRALLQDYLALKNSLRILPNIKILLKENLDLFLTNIILDKIIDFSGLVALLDCSLNDEPGSSWMIKKGFDHNLDRLRELVENGQQEVLKLEKKEIQATGINSLKIRFNNISGYYIEVTNPNLNLVPDYYIEQQMLVNRKRFVTQELKDLERELYKAQNEIDIVQQKVFDHVKNEVEKFLSQLRQLAQALAYLDALYSFATVAYQNNYVAPVFNDKNEIIIDKGRHPVVEQKLEESFEPNNTLLTEKEKLWIITGPNMGGKSTYLRQVSLISVLAQCGSFVPAQNANLSILDRIFTRIGSGDNLVEGKSTFLVEMEETANICLQATKNSLVILDEVGRGTSTFDGIALAQAIIEYIFQKIGAKCLFATHYHELTQLAETFNGICNYYMKSKKIGNKIVFLHQIEKGVAGGSFGLQVARLANLPQEIISRADQILHHIGKSEISLSKKEPEVLGVHDDQIDILVNKISSLQNQIDQKNAIIEQLKDVNLEEFTPKKAFDFLWDLVSKSESL